MSSIEPTASELSYGIRFVLFVFFALYPLGRLLLKTLRVQLQSRLENLTLSLLTGTVCLNTFYFALRWHHQEKVLFPFLILVAVVWFSMFLLEISSSRSNLQLKVSKSASVFFLFLFLITFYHFFYSFHTAVWTPEGGLILRQGAYGDALWKVSVISELEHSLPPQMPILAGHRLTYHYFFELFVVLTHQLTKIDLLDLFLFWTPLYCFILLSCMIFVASSRIFGNRKMALGAFILMMLSLTAEELKRTPHIALAIALFFGIIVLIAEAVRTRQKGTWLLITLLAGHITMFESILSICFIPALILGTLLIFFWKRQYLPFISAAAGIGLAALFQLIANGKIGGRGGESVLTLTFPIFQEAVLDSPPLRHALKSIFPFYQNHPLLTWNPVILKQGLLVPLLFFVSLLNVLVTSLQLGIITIPSVFQKVKSLKSEKIETVFLIIVVTIGFLFPLFFGISYWRGVSLRIFNITGLLLHLFAAAVLFNLWQQSWVKKGAALGLIFLLFVFPIIGRRVEDRSHWGYYTYLSPGKMEVFNYLRLRTPIDSVLLHPFLDDSVRDSNRGGKIAWIYKDHYLYGSALGGRRVVMEGSITGIVSAMAKREDLERIRSEIRRIYTTQDAREARDLLKKYGTSYLWVLKKEPLQYSGKFLKPVLENQDYILYKVLNDSES